MVSPSIKQSLSALSASQMFEIIPSLYLFKFPENIPSEITHVLNMCIQPHPADTSRTRIYLHIPLNDIDDITPEISKIVDFIGHGMVEGKVLVHCALGINRSAAAVICYLCHIHNISASQAMELLQTRKPDVKPSAIFLGQIDRFYGRQEEKEDPLVGFHERLQQRKAGN